MLYVRGERSVARRFPAADPWCARSAVCPVASDARCRHDQTSPQFPWRRRRLHTHPEAPVCGLFGLLTPKRLPTIPLPVTGEPAGSLNRSSRLKLKVEPKLLLARVDAVPMSLRTLATVRRTTSNATDTTAGTLRRHQRQSVRIADLNLRCSVVFEKIPPAFLALRPPSQSTKLPPASWTRRTHGA